jgi:hypothetical protein
VKGINIDKLLVLEGRPNTISEKRDAAELLKAIRARVTVLDKQSGYVEGEAEELATSVLEPASAEMKRGDDRSPEQPA